MKNYLLSVILTSIFIGICDVLTPKHSSIDRFVRFIGMLIIFSIIISPVVNFIRNFDDNILDSIKDNLIPSDEDSKNYDNILKEYLENLCLDDLEKEIKKLLYDNFNIKEEECDVLISTELCDDMIFVSNIKILLSGAAIFKNPYTIEEYISKSLNTECQVLIKAKEERYE